MPKQKIIRGILDKNLDTIGGLSDFLGLLIYSDNAPLPGAGDGAQARYPCASPSFRLPSAPPSCARWAALMAVSIKNTPAGFGRSEVDVLKWLGG